MSLLRTLLARISGLLSSSRRDHELGAELQAHLDQLTEQNISRGLSPEEARYAARRAFGSVEQTKALYRDQRGLPWLDAAAQDLRFSFRSLAKRPLVTLVALLTLALGIGATTSVFSVVDRLLFRSLPYPHDDQLVSFGVRAPFEGSEFMLGPDYLDWRDQQTAFSSIAAIDPGTRDCDLTEKNPERLRCAAVDRSLLSTLGIQPELGRNFTFEEDRPGAASVALLSYAYWTSRFARDPAVVGKTIVLDDRQTEIVGVLPAQFEMPNLVDFDLLVPLALDPSRDRGPEARLAIVRAFGRMKQGLLTSQATALIEPLFENSLKFVPPQFRNEVSFRLRPLRDLQAGDSRLAQWVLLGAVFGVLLVASTNVASLLLAKSSGRRRELAVRRALGATRLRLLRLALAESLLLSLSGGVLGVAFAFLLLRFFVSIAPQGVPRLAEAGIDARILLFTLLVSLLAGLFFGVVPAFEQPVPAYLAGREARAPRTGKFRQVLVAVQIAVSLVLLAGAGLLLRSLWRLERVPLGLLADNVVSAEISLSPTRYPTSRSRLNFFNELTIRFKDAPGISRVAVSDSLPPSGRTQATFLSAIEIPGRPKFAEGTGGMVPWRIISADYFQVLEIPITRGRDFRPADGFSAEFPVILSESLARRLLGDADPIGRQIRFARGPWRNIVGVAANVKNNGLAALPDPEMYLFWKEDPQGAYRSGFLTLRAYGSSAALPEWIRSQVAALDPALPVRVETMTHRVESLAARPRFEASLLTLFSVLALLLAAIGVYGVVASLVVQRTQEIGVRMALGASPRAVLLLILFSIARSAIAGCLLGLLGSWFATRLLESLLFEVRPHDPLLLAVALCVLFLVTLLAASIPARRAMRVDPVVALRYE